MRQQPAYLICDSLEMSLDAICDYVVLFGSLSNFVSVQKAVGATLGGGLRGQIGTAHPSSWWVSFFLQDTKKALVSRGCTVFATRLVDDDLVVVICHLQLTNAAAKQIAGKARLGTTAASLGTERLRRLANVKLNKVKNPTCNVHTA